MSAAAAEAGTRRRGGLALLALLLATGGCDGAVPRAEIRERLRALAAPDVVLIVVDTLRADRLAPYGETRGTSPELADWAARGVVFEHVAAQSSWTKTSMASLMTSLWPRSHGVQARRDGLAEGAVTLAERFREGGYRTYAVQSNGWLEQTFGFHQGFDHYAFPRGSPSPGFRSSVWPHADNVYREAMRLLDAHDPAEPFFLYLHFMDVHEYGAPADLQRFGTGDEGAYLAAIRWVDEVVGRLRADLAQRGRLERAILALASDHGEALGEHGVRGHARDLRAPVLDVPLILRLPFPVEPIRVAARVRNVDVAPTLLELAGLPVPDDFEGESLLPLVLGAAQEPRPSFAALHERLYRDAVMQDRVAAEGFSLLRGREAEEAPAHGSAPRELLFDRRVDAGENVDLVEIEREEADRLRRLLDAHLRGAPRPGVAARDVRIDPGLAEKLRALGYAGE